MSSYAIVCCIILIVAIIVNTIYKVVLIQNTSKLLDVLDRICNVSYTNFYNNTVLVDQLIGNELKQEEEEAYVKLYVEQTMDLIGRNLRKALIETIGYDGIIEYIIMKYNSYRIGE